MTNQRDVTQPLLVKGGSSIEMRLGIQATRVSKDFDAVFRGDFDEMYESARAQLLAGWNGFTAVVAPPEVIDVPGLQVKPRRFKVKLSFKGSAWGTVPVEVSPAEATSALDSDAVNAKPFATLGLGTLGLDEAGAVLCLPLRFQLAQKLHACTAPPAIGKNNDRAHDLIDILLLWPLVDQHDYAAVRRACAEIFDERGTHAWPPQVKAPGHWPALYQRELGSMAVISDLPPTLPEAVDAVTAVIQRIEDTEA